MKKNVLLRAPLLTVSGYGVHSRQIFEWLESRNDVEITVEILRWGVTSWNINDKLDNGIVGRIMSKSKKVENDKYDVSIQVQLPDEWDPKIAKKNIGISAIVETDKCNPDWLKSMDLMDLIIVPSKFSKKVITNTGKTITNIVVVPEWFNTSFENESINQLDVQINTSFNFLTVGQFTGGDPYNDRKNIYFLIKWFCEVFKDDKDVGLIVKSNHGKSTLIDRGITKGTLKKILKEVRPGEYPRLHLIHGNLTSDEMAGLYKRDDVKALVSLTRGEGYGLPLIEAAVSETPVIATNWSGHLDFMNLGKFIKIDYILKDIIGTRVDARIFMEGTRWAEPLESDFKRKIYKFRYKNELPQKWAMDLSKKIKSRFSKASIIDIYNGVFDKFMGNFE